jgi:hypothetical protein
VRPEGAVGVPGMVAELELVVVLVEVEAVVA